MGNDASDFSALQSLATTSIFHTTVASLLSSNSSQVIVGIGKGSQTDHLQVHCGEGQNISEHKKKTQFRCSMCETQTYLFGSEYGVWAQHTLRMCSACPRTGITCDGGTQISANHGYSAKLTNRTPNNSTNSSSFVSTTVSPIKCPRAKSCDGRRPVNVNISTLCATGYEGADSFMIRH